MKPSFPDVKPQCEALTYLLPVADLCGLQSPLNTEILEIPLQGIHCVLYLLIMTLKHKKQSSTKVQYLVKLHSSYDCVTFQVV